MKTSLTLLALLASTFFAVTHVLSSRRSATSSRLLQTPVNEGACQPGWQDELNLFRYRTQVWQQQNTRCYDYTFERLCYCTYQGRIHIAVRNDTVVFPVANEDGYPYAPSIQDIFNTIYTDCFANCPEKGPAVCNITYSAQDNNNLLQSVYVDPSTAIADDEFYYEINDFAFC